MDTVRFYWNITRESIWGIQAVWPLLQGPFQWKEQERTREGGGIDRATLQVTMMAKQEMKQQVMETTMIGMRTMVREPMLGMAMSPLRMTQMIVTGCQMKILALHWQPWLPATWMRPWQMVLKNLVRLVSTSYRPMQLWNVQRGKDPTRDQEKARTRARGRARELWRLSCPSKIGKSDLPVWRRTVVACVVEGTDTGQVTQSVKCPTRNPAPQRRFQVKCQTKGRLATLPWVIPQEMTIHCLTWSLSPRCQVMHRLHVCPGCLLSVPGGKIPWLTRHCPLGVTTFSRLGSIGIARIMRCCTNTQGTMFGDEMNLVRQGFWMSSWCWLTCTMMLIMEPNKSHPSQSLRTCSQDLPRCQDRDTKLPWRSLPIPLLRFLVMFARISAC